VLSTLSPYLTWWHNTRRTFSLNLDLNEAKADRILGLQWRQLDHMQTICTSLQTDNRANTSSLKVTAHKQSAFQGNPKTASKQLGQLVVRHVRCVVVLMSVVVVILSALNKE